MPSSEDGMGTDILLQMAYEYTLGVTVQVNNSLGEGYTKLVVSAIADLSM